MVKWFVVFVVVVFVVFVVFVVVVVVVVVVVHFINDPLRVASYPISSRILHHRSDNGSISSPAPCASAGVGPRTTGL